MLIQEVSLVSISMAHLKLLIFFYFSQFRMRTGSINYCEVPSYSFAPISVKAHFNNDHS